MNRSGAPIVIWLDDDNVERTAQEKNGYHVITPAPFDNNGHLSIEEFRNAILSNPAPDMLLLDVNWRTPTGTSISLDRILTLVFSGVGHGKPIPCYLLTAYDMPEGAQSTAIKGYQEEFGGYLDFKGVLAKPIDLKKIQLEFQGKPKKNSLRRYQKALDDLSVPVRVLDKNRKLVAMNALWTHGNQPDPGNQAQEGLEFRMLQPGKEDEAIGVPARVAAYRISEVQVSRHTLQLAIPLYFSNEHRVEKYLQSLFDLARLHGFTRMRFFRHIEVPGSAGYLRLDWHQGPINLRPVKGIAWRPIGERLASQLQRYETASRGEELVYELVSRKDEMGIQDDDLSYWNTIVEAESLVNWVEVPILCDCDVQNGRRIRPKAIIVLDKYGKAVSEVSRDDIEKSKVSLLAYCVELSRLLEAEVTRGRQRNAEEIQAFYHQHALAETGEKNGGKGGGLQDLSGATTFLSAVLDKACQLSGADHGMIAWTTAIGQIPQACCYWKRGTNHSSPTLNEPISSSSHPLAFWAWETGKSQFACNMKHDTWRGGSADHCRFAVPLKVGSRLYGAISFLGARPYHFDAQRVDAVEKLIEACIFPMTFAAERADRRRWEVALAHEMLTNMKIAFDGIDDITESYPDLREHHEFPFVRFGMGKVEDTINGFMALAKGAADPAEGNCDAEALLDEAITIYDQLGRFRERTIVGGPLYKNKAIVRGESDVLGIVIRTLLHNAIHHGERGNISISSCITGNYWQLDITNPGRMSPEADRLKFTPFALTRRNRDGAHVGLASALQWCRAAGADLEVENVKIDGVNSVRARLCWPLKAQE